MWGVWVNLINKINEQIEFKHEISINVKNLGGGRCPQQTEVYTPQQLCQLYIEKHELQYKFKTSPKVYL